MDALKRNLSGLELKAWNHGQTCLHQVKAMANGDRGYRAAPLTDTELASGKLDLRVFVDRGSVEVYVNGGHQVLSSYSYASEGPRAIKLVAEFGNLKVESLKLHHMKSIGLE